MEEYHILHEIVEYNIQQLEKVDGDQGQAEGLITLFCEKEGVEVWNPFYDTTLRVEVDPIEEYGEEAIQYMIERFHRL